MALFESPRNPAPHEEEAKRGEEVDGKLMPNPALAELAKLAATKGRKVSEGSTPSVFEGDGKAAEDFEPEPPKDPTNSGSPRPPPGAVRVMPQADEQMQKILAARLRKTEE